MNGAARVLAVTDAERRQLAGLGVVPERVCVVPNPLALEEFEPPPAQDRFREIWGVKGPLVAYLGKLTPRKRVDVLVQAFAQLRVAKATLVVAIFMHVRWSGPLVAAFSVTGFVFVTILIVLVYADLATR